MNLVKGYLVFIAVWFLFVNIALFSGFFNFWMSDFLGGLILVGMIYFIGTKVYKKRKKIKKQRSFTVLLIGYLVVSLSMLAYQKKIFSIEWVFLFFVIAAVLFFFFRVDSRYLVLPAIIMLFYCPFLLIYKFDSLAEDVAIFAYYFLVVGVILQFIEVKFKRKLYFNFDRIKVAILDMQWLYYVLFFVLIFTCVRLFFPAKVLLKATSLWLASAFFIVYLIKKFMFEDD